MAIRKNPFRSGFLNYLKSDSVVLSKREEAQVRRGKIPKLSKERRYTTQETQYRRKMTGAEVYRFYRREYTEPVFYPFGFLFKKRR
tara:strand:+ start:459 stop:716 length:258 start_codon:yes stop_codon:yes gene_type:complete